MPEKSQIDYLLRRGWKRDITRSPWEWVHEEWPEGHLFKDAWRIQLKEDRKAGYEKEA